MKMILEFWLLVKVALNFVVMIFALLFGVIFGTIIALVIEIILIPKVSKNRYIIRKTKIQNKFDSNFLDKDEKIPENESQEPILGQKKE